MVYQLHNQQEAANAIVKIQTDATEGQLKISDFKWFIITMQEAINKKLKVDLRYDVPTGLDVHNGIIKSAELIYDSGKPDSTTLTIDFDDLTQNKMSSLTYTFNAELVEENTNSVPGSFMKYYINDDNHTVLVGIIVYYE